VRAGDRRRRPWKCGSERIKVGDRWWISGYTLDDDPDFENRDTKAFAETERFFGHIGPHEPAIAERIRQGELSTVNEAKTALFEAVFKEHPEYREEVLGGSRP
jgi:hypothetical protein